jgi:hypothetical protein
MTQRAVKSYLYEGIVIVASILVAFALDASWANYQESKVERRVLRELHDEFLSAKVRIDTSIAELEIAIEASLELVKVIGSDTVALPPDVAENLFNRLMFLNTLEVPSSVLDSIIASGQVRLISNDELRKALSEWPAFVSDVRENHEWHRTESDEFLVPYLAQHLSIRNAMISNKIIKLKPGTFEYDVLTMQRDPIFEGRLLWRVSRQKATRNESYVLLAETEQLLVLIAAELD